MKVRNERNTKCRKYNRKILVTAATENMKKDKLNYTYARLCEETFKSLKKKKTTWTNGKLYYVVDQEDSMS